MAGAQSGGAAPGVARQPPDLGHSSRYPTYQRRARQYRQWDASDALELLSLRIYLPFRL
jgi:hypothetical protein